MKKVIGMLALIFVLTIIGCSEKPTKTEVIVVPSEPTAPAVPEKPVIVEKINTIVVEKKVPDNSTSIQLDKGGIKLEFPKINVDIEK